ncbi:hypothetical protein Tco_0853534 [Tanacetum coccineum]
MFKFPESEGVVTLHSSRVTPVECQIVTESSFEPVSETSVSEKKGIKVAIHPEYSYQTFTIGGSLTKKGRMELCDLLKNNLDVFAWKPLDMTGVPRSRHHEDYHPLSEIDWKVEPLCRYPFKCFLDAYNGYHQMQMVEEDEEKQPFTQAKEFSIIQKCRSA